MIPQVTVLRESVLERALPTFESIADEADRVSDERWGQLTSGAGPDADPGNLAEAAQDAGVIYYELRHSGRQAVVNSFCIALHHLLEQQISVLVRRELRPRGEGAQILDRKEILQALRERGLDVGALPEWDCLEELRLTANVAKHAEGRSSEDLWRRRPDLFVPHVLKHECNSPLTRFRRSIEGPLAGDDLWVTDEDLRRYFDCSHAFLEALADEVDV